MFPNWNFVRLSSQVEKRCTDVVGLIPESKLLTGNVCGKSCTGGITLKNVLDLSVLHSFPTRFNRKTLFQIIMSL